MPDAAAFRVELSLDRHERRVKLRGELDLAAIDEAERALTRAGRDGGRVVVDLSDLCFIDLAGLRVLLAAHERLGNRLKLRGCTAPVLRLLELTGATERLPLVE